MKWIDCSDREGITTIRIGRERVNALVPEVIDELGTALRAARARDARAIVLTGTGPFFSFGFDVPHMIEWPRERFAAFVTDFCALYRDLFLFPRPVVAAVNGHAIAGGCILALAADARVMARGSAKIALNEITFGASIFAGLVEMLRFHVGSRLASRLLYSGEMFHADDALDLGLVDQVADPERVADDAQALARNFARSLDAFAALKHMLRHETVETMDAREAASIEAFLDVWYAPGTRAQLANIHIR